jgi:hypothetical protein
LSISIPRIISTILIFLFILKIKTIYLINLCYFKISIALYKPRYKTSSYSNLETGLNLFDLVPRLGLLIQKLRVAEIG